MCCINGGYSIKTITGAGAAVYNGVRMKKM